MQADLLIGTTCFRQRGRDYDGCHVFSSLEKTQVLKDMTRRGPDRPALFDIASEQSGYFTAGQAARCGYAPDMLTYDTRRIFQRVRLVVYRLRDYPPRPTSTSSRPGSPPAKMWPWCPTRAPWISGTPVMWSRTLSTSRPRAPGARS